MAAAFINSVTKVGDTGTQDQCEATVLFFGNGGGAREDTVVFFALKTSTDAQFKLAAGNAIVAKGAALGYTLTTANILGAGT